MSQAEVLAVFGPGERLTWNQIIERCEGCTRRTVEQAIVAARKTGKLEVVDTVKTGRRGRSVFVYQVVE